MELKNKVVIVTGGLGGIAFAIIQHLLRNGAKYVGIFDLPQSESQSVVKSLQKLQIEFKKETFGYYTCDVTNKEVFTACYEEVMKLKMYVDVLVNNAGISNEKDISRIVDVNFKAVVNDTMIAIEHMGKHKDHKGGTVVSIALIFGLFGHSMHNETFGVRNLCLCPGVTNTNLIQIDNIRKYAYDFVDTMAIRNILNVQKQDSNNVASAVVQIIKEGKDNTIWLVQNNESAFVVEQEKDLEKLRIHF